MSVTIPTTLFEFGDWCLRKLGGDNMFGKPVGGMIHMDITQQQVIDRLKEAIMLFNNEHYNGYKEVGLVLDIELGVTSYKLPDEILAILYYLNLDDKTNMFSFDYQMRQSMGMNWGKMGGFDLVTVELVYEYLKLVDMKIGKKFNYNFNALTHTIDMLIPAQGPMSVALVCYMLEDVEGSPDLFTDIWLKEYSVQLIKQQIGTNLKKFDNVNLPAGATLTGQTMYDEATSRLEELKEDLETKYSYPPMFFMG